MTLPAAFSLAGRVALVTGAGSPDGIGFATARLLASMGAAVAVGATTERIHERAAELTAAGVRAVRRRRGPDRRGPGRGARWPR